MRSKVSFQGSGVKGQCSGVKGLRSRVRVRVVKFWDQGSKVKSKSQCVKYLRSGVKVRVVKGQRSMVKGQKSKYMVSKTRASARGLGLRVRVARVVKGLGRVSRFRVKGQGLGGVNIQRSNVRGQGLLFGCQGPGGKGQQSGGQVSGFLGLGKHVKLAAGRPHVLFK